MESLTSKARQNIVFWAPEFWAKELTYFTLWTGLGNFLWNPGYPGMFAVCLGKGSVSVMEVIGSDVKVLASLPASVQASASELLCHQISAKHFQRTFPFVEVDMGTTL